jgi:hypothetical protein
VIECINLAITDRCNRSCPECCCDVPRIKEHWEISLTELHECAEEVGHVKRLTLTGGEPTIHYDFEFLVDWLKYNKFFDFLELSTNGYLFDKSPEIFERFDKIFLSNYVAPEFEPNWPRIKAALSNPKLKGKLEVWAPIHHEPRSGRGTKKCPRGYFETVSIYKGRMYPCCMGWGIEDPVSIPLTKNWREEIIRVELPCNRCFFAEK